MEFGIDFYKDEKGNSPVEDFLDKLELLNNPLYKKTLKGIAKLKERFYHQEPFSKYLESGLWELRTRAGTDILRIVYTFQKGRMIILLHVFVKKQQKTPAKELEIARKRLKEVKLQEVN